MTTVTLGLEVIAKIFIGLAPGIVAVVILLGWRFAMSRRQRKHHF